MHVARSLASLPDCLARAPIRFLIDGQVDWMERLPAVIDAFIVGTQAGIGEVRDRFAREYGLIPGDIPTLGFTCDCEEPFVLADLVPFDPCNGGQYRIVG